MLTLRCTRALLRSLAVKAEQAPPASTTVLGDWYGNDLRPLGIPLVLFTCELSLLPVLAEPAPLPQLLERLRAGLGEVLGALHVPAEAVARELAQMEAVTVATTANRRVVGVMGDYVNALALGHGHGARPPSLLAEALHLARTPCSPLGVSSPDRVTVDLFAGRWEGPSPRTPARPKAPKQRCAPGAGSVRRDEAFDAFVDLLGAPSRDMPRAFERPEHQRTVSPSEEPWEGVEPEALYVFKLGPVEESDAPDAAFYAALSPSGGMAPPVMGASDAEGLRAVRDAHPDRPLLCDASLAAAGRPLGFLERPAPRAVLEARATSAVLVSRATEDAQPVLGHLETVELLHGCADFARAAPWRWWTDELPFRVRLQGDVSGEHELCVMGAGREEFGFVLFDRPGAMAQVAQGRAQRQPDSLGLSLEDSPPWAVEPIEALTGVPFVPALLRARAGKGTLAGSADAVVAAGVAFALAQAARLPTLREVNTLFHGAGRRFSVQLEVPYPLFSGRYVGPMLPPAVPVATRTARQLPAAPPAQVLVDFAGPILDAPGGNVPVSEVFRMLAVALAVWNAKVLERWEEPEPWLERVRDTVRRLSGPTAREMLEHVDLLATAYDADEAYEDDPRLFDALQVEAGRDGDFAVRLASTVTPGAWPEYLGVPRPR